MTLREQLIQEVLDAPDFLVSALLKLLRLIRSGREGMAQRLTQFLEYYHRINLLLLDECRKIAEWMEGVWYLPLY